MSSKENGSISKSITKLLKTLAIICNSAWGEGKFICGIFSRDIKDGNKNDGTEFENVSYKHFMVESINNVIKLIKPNVYMASIDLKDVFLLVPTQNEHQKYLKFIYQSTFWIFEKSRSQLSCICR